MGRGVAVELFAEDAAHERFLRAMIARLAGDHQKNAVIRARSVVGGHGRAIAELALYQRTLMKIGGGRLPDALVVAIDSNCKAFSQAVKSIQSAVKHELAPISVIACPEPHVERWYMADPSTFRKVIGVPPPTVKRKCDRDRYKSLLASTVKRAGHRTALGGIDFADDLVESMDLKRASAAERSLRAFIEAMTARLKAL